MRTIAQFMFAVLTLSAFAPFAQGDGYPEATLDQATHETMCGLRIERYAGLDENGLQAEYEWALAMAKLCVEEPEALRSRKSWSSYAIEFQRHAARTARYRGFGEQALADYERAIEYAYDPARLALGPAMARNAQEWEKETIYRDLANTYVMMGAYDQAVELTHQTLAWLGSSADEPSVHSTDLNRLAECAQRQGRPAEALQFQQRAVEGKPAPIAAFLEHHPELDHIKPGLSWDRIVRDPRVRVVLEREGSDDGMHTLELREVYLRYARALRLNNRLDEAAYALKTAELTPWQRGRLRDDLDFYVEREWALLALAQGKAKEALRRGKRCLEDYENAMLPDDRVEMLDLVSRALEQTGEAQEAFDKLQRAIEIVETRRANLVDDWHKQTYSSGYAPLYRRALDLCVKIHSDKGADAAEAAFEWSERVKARAMLDTLLRYGQRMATASAAGDTDAVRALGDLAGQVVSIDQLRKASWWPGDTALLEYTYGDAGAVYLWVVTESGGSLRRLEARADDVDRHCDTLSDALGRRDPRDESWVAPASWLFEQVIAPVMPKLGGIKRLIVVGDRKLRTLPFEVMVARRDAHVCRYIKHHLLIEDYVISYAPSTTLLATISERKRPTSWESELWAFASTTFHPTGTRTEKKPKSPGDSYKAILRSARELSLDDLQYAGKEVEQVASRFNSDAVKKFIDKADKPTMKETLLDASKDGKLRSVRFLHFATHAVADPKRPYLSGLILCPPFPVGAEDKPADSGGKSREGARHDQAPVTADKPFKRSTRQSRRPERLTLEELAGLKLDCEMVVLSACHSLGATAVEGDWLHGLARAFLVAGSGGVICTTADTPDRAALAVMPTLYYALLTSDGGSGASTDVPKALQQVKLSSLRSPMSGHPSIWAPWVYHGRVLPN